MMNQFRILAHLRSSRPLLIAIVVLLCLLLSPTATLARSRTRMEVTLPGREGHPNGEYGVVIASAPRALTPMLIWQWFRVNRLIQTKSAGTLQSGMSPRDVRGYQFTKSNSRSR